VASWKTSRSISDHVVHIRLDNNGKLDVGSQPQRHSGQPPLAQPSTHRRRSSFPRRLPSRHRDGGARFFAILVLSSFSGGSYPHSDGRAHSLADLGSTAARLARARRGAWQHGQRFDDLFRHASGSPHHSCNLLSRPLGKTWIPLQISKASWRRTHHKIAEASFRYTVDAHEIKELLVTPFSLRQAQSLGPWLTTS
jgi:hypothetical protein